MHRPVEKGNGADGGSHPQARRWFLLSLLFTFLATGISVFGAEPVSREFQLKAAFLYNFAKFIEWPPRSFATPSSPIVIAVLGRNVFGTELDRAVQGRSINGHGIVVKTIQTIDAVKNAHLVFISSAEDGRLEEVREICRGAGVLTVGETETFALRGGSIAFKLEGDKLRFELNVDTAEQSGLKISAQLQKLAANIIRK